MNVRGAKFTIVAAGAALALSAAIHAPMAIADDTIACEPGQVVIDGNCSVPAPPPQDQFAPPANDFFAPAPMSSGGDSVDIGTGGVDVATGGVDVGGGGVDVGGGHH